MASTPISVLTRDGQTHVVEAEVTQSVMEAIRGAGIGELLAICFGCCSCALCHVYVEEGADALPPPSDDEAYVLSGSGHRTLASRLSCQIRAVAGHSLTVRIAPED